MSGLQTNTWFDVTVCRPAAAQDMLIDTNTQVHGEIFNHHITVTRQCKSGQGSHTLIFSFPMPPF
jgi:hypothetical protein